MKLHIAIFFFALAGGLSTLAGGIRLEGFEYPYPVQIFKLSSQQQGLEMAYMDVRPLNNHPETVVLLHGKNFSGAYWGRTAAVLSSNGFRVIIPDQLGFGKSSKPGNYQFSFEQLAWNTHELLNHCGVTKAHILGHSMGGMIATRYALMYPGETATLVLTDPLGLEDWRAKGVPYTPVDREYQTELKQTPEKIRAYERENYFHGQWRPDYEPGMEMLGTFLRSEDYPRMAWDQALTYDMIFTQPVCHDFGNLQMPVLLIIGQADRTATGKDLVSSELRDKLGNYPELGRLAATAIPHAQLVELEGIGHVPQLEAFERFIGPLEGFLKRNPYLNGAADKVPPTGN